MNQLVSWRAGTTINPASCESTILPARLNSGSERPRVVSMPAAWWDSPPAACSPLDRGLQSVHTARRLTRKTLRDWGLMSLADDAQAIVSELAANAVTHAAQHAADRQPARQDLSLRLLRRAGQVICAVLDPNDAPPVLKAPSDVDEAGRGLQVVDALSDEWGWSPIADRGKAVWAILTSW